MAKPEKRTYRGVSYEVGPRSPYPGIRWKIPTFDAWGRPTGALESGGAFYDGCEDHPEGAYAWADASARRRIDTILEK